jgi:hypothetical protein
MLRLPRLEPEERAYLHGLGSEDVFQALAKRLRQRLVATLGAQVAVRGSLADLPEPMLGGNEPVIRIEPDLALAWLAVRLGGKPGRQRLKLGDETLHEPFRLMVRRALAETVVNLGAEAYWPRALGLDVTIGGQQGAVEIFWNSEHALAWAHRAIREKP